MLQNVLNSIPGYLIRGENDNILYHMAKAWIIAKTSPEIKIRRDAMNSDEWHDPRYGKEIDPWFGCEQISPPELGSALAGLFINKVLQPEEDTRAVGFKEIRFHLAGDDMELYLDFILNFFPDSKLIFNTRELNDVAKSGWWANYSPADFAAEVGDADKRFRNYAKNRPNRTILMHYDDYKGNPEGFRRLFEFLEEAYDKDYVSCIMSQKLDHVKKKWKKPE